MFRISAGVLFLFTLLGCHRTFNAQVQHATGTLLSSSNPVQWRDTSWEQYVTMIAQGNFALECLESRCFLPDAHPIPQRLNAWMAELHRRLALRNPPLAAVPTPMVIVAEGAAPGAFTDTLSTCLDFPTRIEGSRGTKIFSDGALSVMKGTIRDTSTCLPGGNDGNFAIRAAEFSTETTFPCRLVFSGNEVSIGSECRRNKYFDDFYGSNRSAFPQISNRILLTRGLLRAMESEEQVLAVLFHEMAHYYRAHPIIPERNFTVFHVDSDTAENRRPVENTDMRALGEEILRVQADKRAPDRAERLAALTERMNRERLGYYSFEQEADEISLEFLTEMGIAPEAAVETQLNILKTLPASTGRTPFPVCLGWFQSNWKDPAGNPIRVPLGSLADPHHDFCYRVFNLTRETRAHRFVLGPRPTFPPVNWKTFAG